jgi:hypothetical protein
MEIGGAMALPLPIPSALGQVDLDEEIGPWCVDLGTSIEVMKTEEIRQAVESGSLSAETKAWCDGRPYWLPIAEFPELSPPDKSGPRRIVRPAPRDSEPLALVSPVDTLPIPLVSIRAAFLSAIAIVTAGACIAVGIWWRDRGVPAVRPAAAHLAEHVPASE